MIRKTVFAIAFICVCITSIALMLELSVRLLHIGPELPGKSKVFTPKPHLRYHYIPNTFARVRTPEYSVTYKYNSQGLRDRERTVEKPEGTIRIIGIGDSFTEGVGVEYPYTYLSILENGLNKKYKDQPIDVVKAGIAGYDPKAEKQYLKYYGMKYDPDVILLAYSGTDSKEAAMGVHYTVSKQGYLLNDTGYLLNGFTLNMYIHSRVARIILRKWIDHKRTRFSESHLTQSERNALWEEGWSKLFDEYNEIRSIAKHKEIPLIVIYIPFRINFENEEQMRADRLAVWCQNNSVPFINLLPVFRSHPNPSELHWPIDGHCTIAGNALIANELYKFLTKEDFLLRVKNIK